MQGIGKHVISHGCSSESRLTACHSMFVPIAHVVLHVQTMAPVMDDDLVMQSQHCSYHG